MKALSLVPVALVLGIGLAFWSCNDPNEEPRLSAEIQAFTATPGVVSHGEAAELRWHVEDAIQLRLLAYRGSAMPDARQAWTCMQERGERVCTAARPPEGGEGWDCAGDGPVTCRSATASDPEGYRTVEPDRTLDNIGTLSMVLDETTTFRLEAEGNTGSAAMAWAQVVLTEGVAAARILDWTAVPAPALVGEQVTLSYRTEGCDQIDYAANPRLGGDDWTLQEGSNASSGQIVWHDATATRDFYLGCHPEGDVETSRIRSHITVVVVQQPEVCERIDLFSINPSENVVPGSEVEITWRVSNAAWVEGVNFHIGSTSFSGSRSVPIEADTTFGIIAHGACGEVSEEASVTIASGADGDADGDVDGDADGDL